MSEEGVLTDRAVSDLKPAVVIVEETSRDWSSSINESHQGI
jgi:hypothetical protein